MASQTPLTLGEMLDQIRRQIQQVPLYDITGSTGDIGLPSPSFPWPNNNLLIQLVNESIDAINRQVRAGKVVVITAAVTRATQPGPYVVDFSGSVTDANNVSEAMDIGWQPSSPASSQVTRLEKYEYYAGVRNFNPFDPMNPDNTPTQWSQTGTQILLVPPPNQAGTLYILQQQGLDYLVNLGDTLSSYFPVNYQCAVWYYATYLLCSLATSDVEMADRAQSFLLKANTAITQVYDWKNGQGQVSIQAQNDMIEMLTGMTKPRSVASPPVPTPGNQQGGR